MKLLQTVVFVLTVLLSATAASAEANDPQVQALKKHLNLTEKQTRELDKVLKETRSKLEALRKEMMDVRKKQEERMSAIFTPEQEKKYEEMGDEHFSAPGIGPAKALSSPAPQPPPK